MLTSIFRVYIADKRDFLFSFEEVNCLSQSLCCLAAFQLSDLHLFHSGSLVKLAALAGSTPTVGHPLLAKPQMHRVCTEPGVSMKELVSLQLYPCRYWYKKFWFCCFWFVAIPLLTASTSSCGLIISLILKVSV